MGSIGSVIRTQYCSHTEKSFRISSPARGAGVSFRGGVDDPNPRHRADATALGPIDITAGVGQAVATVATAGWFSRSSA
ncbi:hypothetical protein NJ7G_1838 [Natrinema sp. J7-2]|nr:hypothetical protein NJ7G_1838 [Natrinema sp. J7-2]